MLEGNEKMVNERVMSDSVERAIKIKGVWRGKPPSRDCYSLEISCTLKRLLVSIPCLYSTVHVHVICVRVYTEIYMATVSCNRYGNGGDVSLDGRGCF